MRKAWIPAVVAVAAAAAIGGAFHFFQSGARPPAAMHDVSLSSDDEIMSGLIYLALDQGFFARHGLQVSLVKTSAGMASIRNVLGGRSDFGVATDIPIMFQAMQDRSLVILATLAMTDGNMGVVARRESHIADPADFRGRRIGVALGTAAHYYLDRLLVAADLSRDDVVLVDLPPGQLWPSLASGAVDAIVLWELALSDARAHLGSAGVTINPHLAHPLSWCLVTRRSFDREHPELVKAMLASLMDAERLLAAEPARARRIIARRINRDVRLVEGVWSYYKLGLGLDQSLIVALEEESRWAMATRQSGRAVLPNYLDFIDFAPLAAVKPAAVSIVR